MSNLQSLPREIYIAIFEHVEVKKDILSIVHASRTFHDLALPLLYRNIETRRLNTPRLLTLLHRLASDQRLSRPVKSFHLVHGASHGFLTGDLALDTEIVALVLLSTVNLVELEIRIPERLPWDTLCRCVFRLRKFSFEGTQVDLDSLLRFLQVQGSLVELDIPSYLSGMELSEPILPNVRRFRGSAMTAQWFWRSSPHIPDDICCTDSDGSAVFPWLERIQDGRRIRKLSVILSIPQMLAQAVETEVSCLDSLVVVSGELPEFVYMSMPRPSLAKFKNLRSFTLEGRLTANPYVAPSGSGPPAVIQTEAMYLQSIVEMWRECPSLERVSLPKYAQPNWVFCRSGDQWSRCS